MLIYQCIIDMQSLRLSTDNEQNLCNLAHCFLGGCVCPHLAASVKVGVKRVPQALQTCILTFNQLAYTRLPGRTKARPYDRMVFSAIYYVENK